MALELLCNGKRYQLALDKTRQGYLLKIGDQQIPFDAIPFYDHCYKINLDGSSRTVHIAIDKEKILAHIDGLVLTLESAQDQTAGAGSAAEEIVGGIQKIRAPMPGKIVKIPVSEGQAVEEKAILCVVEAMKMENEVRARVKGIVKNISFKPGDLVGTEDIILTVEPPEKS